MGEKNLDLCLCSVPDVVISDGHFNCHGEYTCFCRHCGRLYKNNEKKIGYLGDINGQGCDPDVP